MLDRNQTIFFYKAIVATRNNIIKLRADFDKCKDDETRKQILVQLIAEQKSLIDQEALHLVDVLDYNIMENKKLILPSRDYTNNADNEVINMGIQSNVDKLTVERTGYVTYKRTVYTTDYENNKRLLDQMKNEGNNQRSY